MKSLPKPFFFVATQLLPIALEGDLKINSSTLPQSAIFILFLVGYLPFWLVQPDVGRQ
jgi:hypothetical protein